MKLLIGGSPCTHWSIAQTKNRETEASGIGWELFLNYRIARDKYKSDFFLYENNKSMSPAIRAQITAELRVEPILINSALISAQNRQRLYWAGKRRDLFSVMLTHWRLLVWSPVLFCALRRFFSNRQPVLQQKRRSLPTGAMLPLKMNAFAHFVFKKDLIQQIRSNRTMCVRACQSFFCRTRCKKEGLRPPFCP